MKLKDNSFYGGISKFFSVDLQVKMQDELDIKNGDILFMVGDQSKIVFNALGNLRNEIAKKEKLISMNKYYPVWVTEFPMFEFDEDNGQGIEYFGLYWHFVDLAWVAIFPAFYLY